MAIPPIVLKLLATKFLNTERVTYIILALVIGVAMFLMVLLLPVYLLLNPIDTIKALVSNEDDIKVIGTFKGNNSILEIKELVYKGGVLPVPVEGVVTSEYGERIIFGKEDFHTGIDISGVWHDKIISVESGVVTFSGIQNGYGNCIEIKHKVEDKEFYTFYAHLSKRYAVVGQQVIKGNVIGLEGGDPVKDENAGTSTGHHLHFEIRTKSGYGSTVNPRQYLFGS